MTAWITVSKCSWLSAKDKWRWYSTCGCKNEVTVYQQNCLFSQGRRQGLFGFCRTFALLSQRFLFALNSVCSPCPSDKSHWNENEIYKVGRPDLDAAFIFVFQSLREKVAWNLILLTLRISVFIALPLPPAKQVFVFLLERNDVISREIAAASFDDNPSSEQSVTYCSLPLGIKPGWRGIKISPFRLSRRSGDSCYKERNRVKATHEIGSQHTCVTYLGCCENEKPRTCWRIGRGE